MAKLGWGLSDLRLIARFTGGVWGTKWLAAYGPVSSATFLISFGDTGFQPYWSVFLKPEDHPHFPYGLNVGPD